MRERDLLILILMRTTGELERYRPLLSGRVTQGLYALPRNPDAG